MGFITKQNDIVELVAKLTPYGRQQILSNSNSNVVKYFSLGDSEANYASPLTLGNGEIPVIGGNATEDLTMADDYEIKHKIIVDSLGNTKKVVETNSNVINVTKERLGQNIVDNTKLSQYIVNRNEFNSDARVNWLYGFGLPVTENDKTLFNSVSSTNGGFSDTALATLNADKYLIISVDDGEFGELIDGKTIKTELTTLVDTYNIFGTYQNNLTPKETQDTKLKEITTKSKMINNNIVFLFSDKIQKPNNDATKSWSTGFNKTKPYSVNGKELFNLTENSSTGAVKDVCVGVAYLDKGIVVITHPDIVNNYDVNDATADNAKVTFNSVVTKISQDVVCIVGRGEFTSSTNKTYNSDDIRVSEIGIYDGANKLIALAKPNKHLVIGNNDFKAIGIKISV
jgi:hypothetical protein